MVKCLERYEEVLGRKVAFKTVSTPYIDQRSFTESETHSKGELSAGASKVLMKVLYGARMGRWDLLRELGQLSQNMTKWTVSDDKRLFQVMSYIWSTLDYELEGHIGDPIAECWLDLYADADHASGVQDKKSTNGAIIILRGNNTWFPLMPLSQKQRSTATSTPEAEIVSAFKAMKAMGIPFLQALDFITGLETKLTLHEDNQSCLQIIQKGYSYELRHAAKTQGIDISFLHECFVTGDLAKQCKAIYENTDHQVADIFTKALSPKDFIYQRHRLGIRLQEETPSVSKLAENPTKQGGENPNKNTAVQPTVKNSGEGTFENDGPTSTMKVSEK